MAGQEEQDDTKTLEPSQRRLDQAREKGDIPRSNDLTAAVGYLGMLIAFAAGGSYLTNRLGDAGVSLIAQAPAWGALMLHGGHGAAPHGALLTEVGLALAPVALVPMGLVLGALVAMRGLAFAPSKLAPKLSRVSPVEVAKQKFGLSGMVEFAKSFAKLVIYSAALGFYLWTRLDDIVLSATLESRPATLLIGRMSVQFLAIVVLIAAVFLTRLERGMRLETDPTVIYGVTEGQGVLGRGLRRSELNRATPWNTYVIEGLPPTPIANPGRAAIEAALNPADTDFLFFVADGTGGHVFAETLAEHNINVQRWRQIERQRNQ